jgi:hypothetical protein
VRTPQFTHLSRRLDCTKLKQPQNQTDSGYLSIKMHVNPAKTALAALALLGSVQAHTRFTTLFVDGQNQGDAVCIRMDMDGEKTNSPISGIQSPEMACGKKEPFMLMLYQYSS